MAVMTKKPKATVYADVDALTKRRLERLAKARHRKLAAEVQLALDRYLDAEEKKERDLPPLEEEAE